MMVFPSGSFLVKTAPDLHLRASMGRLSGMLVVERLFEVDGSLVWYRVTPTAGISGAHPWDVCHALLEPGVLADRALVPHLIEPDWLQRWDASRGITPDDLFGRTGPPHKQDRNYPTNKDMLWFQDDNFAQFAGISSDGLKDVLVAHVDTGYDPTHLSLPPGLNWEWQRNFVDPGDPYNAADTGAGGPLGAGHGTGTLGVLAGNAFAGMDKRLKGPIGAAPAVGVLPLRVADTPMLFRDSAIACAFSYIHQLSAGEGYPTVHAVTMSMAGVPAGIWADGVNRLYEDGVFVVAAAGNNFGDLPTRDILYPAAFKRVLAACGVMANHKPYAELAPRLLEANYGPPEKMATAMASYSPNVAFARFGCPTIVDFDGGGTSMTTPQIAAAAAFWIARHKAAWANYPEPWMKVEAVRLALYRGADTSMNQGTPDLHFGQGLLKARNAAGQKPPSLNDLVKQPQDSVAWPLVRALTGANPQEPDARKRTRESMLELEALQLRQSLPPQIQRALDQPVSAQTREMVRQALISHPAASRTLRAALAARRPSGHSQVAAPHQPPAIQVQDNHSQLDPQASPSSDGPP